MRNLSLTTILWLALCIYIHPAFAQNKQGYLELTHVLQRVYHSNPTLMAAREELKETRELYKQARAGWLPSVNAEASIFATDVESSNFGVGDGATTKDVTLSLDQPIWRGGRTFAETARANDLIRAGTAYLIQREQEIFLETATLYLNVLRDWEIFDLRQKNHTILIKELQAARNRKELGEITETDVQQAKSRASRAKSEMIAAERDYEISRNEFEEIVGFAPPRRMMVPYLKFNMPETVTEMVDMAVEHNPEVLISQFEQEAAEHNADAQFRVLMPQVSAFASYNRQYDPQPGIVDKSQTETIGLRATLSLYAGGATRSRTREAKHEAKRRGYLIESVKRRITQEVKSNWRAYSAAQSLTENRKREIEAAEQALKGVHIEAEAGQRTVLNILDADQELIEAKSDLAEARRDELLARFTLAKTLGFLDSRSLFTK